MCVCFVPFFCAFIVSFFFWLLFSLFCIYKKVLDPPQGDEAGPASRGAFGIHAGAELASEGHRLWSALAETSHATASRFSRLVRLAAGLLLLAPTPTTDSSV